MRDGRCAAAALVARLAVFAASVFLVCWAIHGFAWGILKDVNGYDSPYTPASGAKTENLGFLRLCSGRFPSISTTAEARGRSCSARFRIRDGGTISPALRPSRARRPKWQSRWDLSRWQRLAQFRACGAGAAFQAALSAGLQPDWAVLFCWSAIVLFGAMMLGSRVQLGQRYLLPMYPMLYFLAADALWSLSVQCTGSGQTVSSARCAAVLRGPMPRVAAAVVLLTVQVASALAIAPHYLAYFSPIAGGPTAGYRLLADSNIDWGQDLPLLRAKLEQMGCRRALLRYSGTANPEASRCRTTPLDRSAIEEFFEFECLAVSVNDLSGYHRIVNPRLIAVATFEPTARAGYSIFIFDLRVPKLRRSIGDRLERLCGDRPRSRAERNIEMR